MACFPVHSPIIGFSTLCFVAILVFCIWKMIIYCFVKQHCLKFIGWAAFGNHQSPLLKQVMFALLVQRPKQNHNMFYKDVEQLNLEFR
jgi:hypothetical protein